MNKKIAFCFLALILSSSFSWLSGQSPAPALQTLDMSILSAEATRQEALEGKLRRGNIDFGQSTIQYWSQARTEAATSFRYPLEKEELAVVDFAPTGELPVEMQRPTIYVMFNLPMVPLAKLGEPISSTPLMTIQPAIAGTYRWYGTKVLSFQPKASLVGNPRYTVTIPASASSLGGRLLGKPFSFEFNTEAIKIVNFYAGNNPETTQSNSEVPTKVGRFMVLEFNQAVDPAFLKQHLNVNIKAAGTERSAGFSISRPDYSSWLSSRTTRAVLLTLDKEPPESARVQVVLKDKAAPFAGYPVRNGDQAEQFQTITPFMILQAESYSYDMPRNNQAGTVPVYIEFSHPLDKAAANATYRIQVNGQDAKPQALDVFGTILRVGLPGLQPEDVVSVQAPALVKDKFGRPLSNPSKIVVTKIPVPEALISFPWDFHHLEAAFPPKFIWAGRNLDTLFFAKAASDRFSFDLNERSKANKPALLPYNISTWKPNKVNYFVFDLAKLLNPTGFGTAYFNFKSTYSYSKNRKETTNRTFAIQVTDLGITTRVAFNQVLVWVNSLSTGKPVAGATIDLGQTSTSPLRSAQTDETGLAVFSFKAGEFNSLFPMPDYNTGKRWLLVAATKGSDRADAEFSNTVSSWGDTIYGHDSVRRVEDPLSRVMIFTDRGLYKGGEELALRGIHWLQSSFGFKPYAGKVNLELKDSRSGKVLWTWQGKPSENGGFATRFRLPADLEPGIYTIRYIHEGPATSRYGDSDYNFTGVSFTIANFRKLAFQVQASVPDRSYFLGDDASITINASYLAGGSMPKADYSYYWTRKPVPYTPPGTPWSNFVFGPGNWEGEHTLTNGKGSLGGNGQTVLSVKTSDQNAVGSAYDYVLETTVQDIDRQAIANTAHVMVHPAAFYLGLRFTTGGTTGWWSRFVATGKPVTAKAVLVDPQGRSWTAGTKVSATILKAEWKASEQQGVYGRVNTRWEYVETEISRQELIAEKGEVSWNFQVKDAGDYLLAIVANDTEGRASKTVIRFYATGSNWVRRASETPSDIDLIPDKESYLPGETARILVRSPIEEGDYLLTTEREGIYGKTIIHLKGGQSMINVPVAEKHVPVFYVALTSFTKREAVPTDFYEPDLGRPRGLFGIVGLKVSTKPVELDVSIKPDQTVYQPGKQASVTIKVSRNGKPVANAEVTALAVDRAVLDLINYHVPDPLKYFYDLSHFPLAVEGDDSRRLLMKPVAYDTSALTGGDGDGEKPNERKDFQPLALFDPFVKTNDQGEATVRFKFPDSLTTYRMTAMAVSGSRVGIKEGELLVQNPINVRTAMPRKFRNRDTAAAGVILQNLTAISQKVDVTAESTILTVGGAKTRSVEIPPNGSYELPFILSATSAGEGTISFTIKSAVINEKLTEKVLVEQPLIKEAFTTIGTIAREDSSATEGLILPSAIAAGYGSLSLQVSSTLRPYIEPSLSRLLISPEPWWSHYRKLLYSFPAAYTGTGKDTIANLLKELKGRQQTDGGIYTGSYGRLPYLSDPYISLLTAHFLEFAAERKYALGEVPDLGRLLVYLGERQREFDRFDPYFHAYANLILAAGAKADKTYLARTEDTEDKLGLAGYGLLCQAYLAAGDKVAASRVYKRSKNFVQIGTQSIDLKDTYEVSNYWSSELAEMAILLRNANFMGEDKGFIMRVAGALNKSQRNWRGLNDDLWIILGFLPILDAEGPSQGSAQVKMSTAKQNLAEFKLSPAQAQGQKSLEFNAAPLASLSRDQLLPLDLAKTGDTPVYYTMILRYALPNETATARDEGLEVNQRYETLDGTLVGEQELKLGETYRIRVDVSSTKRRARLELLVPIPNGLEIVDPTFVTSGAFKNKGGAKSENINRETIYGDTINVAAEGYGGWDDGDWYWYWYQPDSFALDNMMVYRWQDFYAGTRTVTFLARVTTPGIYPTPPASASLEFEPEVFGRTEGKLFVIKP